ncbi:MAG TPA: hypothetical protein VE616_15765 [Candidatus Udaeobacter sp.]|jgi:hypothetical protein|nr:hypothetical protein [Candidatus Udaeobacter sp.]
MKDERAVIDLSWWRLQADVAWGRVLLSIATMHEGAAVRPEIYLFLGDRYWRLARRHFVRGRRRSAQRLVRTARLYFRQGGGPEPPPLAAASMPIPEAPSFTSAIGAARGGGGSGDAA